MSGRPYDYRVEIDWPKAGAPAACGACDWRGTIDRLTEIGGCSLTPGDASPAGRCPKCDSLAYLVRPQRDSAPDLLAALRRLLNANRAYPENKRELIEAQDAAAAIVAKAEGGQAVEVEAPEGVRRFLDLSTGHLMPETRARFEDGESPLLAYPHPDGFGWFVWVPPVPEPGEDDQAAEFPADLRACVERARALGCDYLLFDSDAGYLAGLPSYDDDGKAEGV